jgi:hypothetical protein
MENHNQGIEVEKPQKIEIIYVVIMAALVIFAFIGGRLTKTTDTFKDCREQYDVWIFKHCKCWENVSDNPYANDYQWGNNPEMNYTIPIFKEEN